MAKDTSANGSPRRLSALYENSPPLARDTPEGRQRLEEYYSALGKFVDEFSRVEAVLPISVAAYAKLPENRARALLAGLRVEAAISHLRRLQEVDEVPAEHWKRLEPVLAQLAHLNSARNLLLHYGAREIAEGSGHASNARLVHVRANVRSIPISPKIMDEMIYDLRKICLHLIWFHVGRPKPAGSHPALEEVIAGSWRYKPPQQANKGSQNTKKVARAP